jgi:hypothetical protein
MAKFLFEVEQHNRLEQRGVLKRFSMNCIGKQNSQIDLRMEKAHKFHELTRGTPEYEKWFMKYTPKAPGVMPKAPGVMPKAPGVMPKAPDVMPKAPDVMPKAPDVMPKAQIPHSAEPHISPLIKSSRKTVKNFVNPVPPANQYISSFRRKLQSKRRVI